MKTVLVMAGADATVSVRHWDTYSDRCICFNRDRLIALNAEIQTNFRTLWVPD